MTKENHNNASNKDKILNLVIKIADAATTIRVFETNIIIFKFTEITREILDTMDELKPLVNGHALTDDKLFIISLKDEEDDQRDRFLEISTIVWDKFEKGQLNTN